MDCLLIIEDRYEFLKLQIMNSSNIPNKKHLIQSEI